MNITSLLTSFSPLLPSSFSILLEFQTVSSDTILLYTQRKWDFLALELRDGRLIYSYNLGSGRTNISSTDTYSDGLLHVVRTAVFNYSEVSIYGSVEVWLINKCSPPPSSLPFSSLLFLSPLSLSSLFPPPSFLLSLPSFPSLSSLLAPPSFFFLFQKVELHRTGRSGELVVDGGLEIASGSSPGNFTALNIHSTMLYVGGTPTTMPPTSLVGPRANYSVPPSALACFHALAINNRYVDLR